MGIMSGNEGRVSESGPWFKRFLKQNWGTILLFAFLLGYLAYQKVPLYIKDSQYIGKKAPDFELVDMKGQTVRLSDLKGKVVLINFWATWCGPCRVEIPALKSMYSELAGEDFEMLAVASESEPVIRNFIQENPVNYPVLLDTSGRVANLYQINVYPSFVFINREGFIDDIDHGMNFFLKWKIQWKVTGSPF